MKSVDVEPQAACSSGSPQTTGVARLLSSGCFLPYAMGQVLFGLADAIFSIVLTITVYRLTQSGAGLSGLMLVRFAPLVLLGPLAGVFVDRLSKRSILAGCNLAFAIICLGLGFTTAVWQVLLLVFLYACTWTLYKPARYATIPLLVGSSSILLANSVLMTVDEVVGITGATLGAVLARLAGQYPYWANALLLLGASAILWLGLRGREGLEKPPCTHADRVRFSLFADMAAGWNYMMGHRQLLPLSVAVALIWLSLGMFMSVQIIYVSKALALPDYYYGYASALAGAGSIVGFLLSPVIVQRLRVSKWTVFPAGYLMAAVFAALTAISHSIWLSTASILLLWIGSGASNAVEETMEQQIPAEAFRGKVISFISTIGTVGYLLGITAGPLSSDLAGVRPVIAVSACLLFTTSFVIWRFLNQRLDQSVRKG